LFVAGALSVIRYAKIHGTKHRPWLTALLARRPTKVAAIALANKLARMAWAMMASGAHPCTPVSQRLGSGKGMGPLGSMTPFRFVALINAKRVACDQPCRRQPIHRLSRDWA
jgi:hypothetical protein